MRGIRTAALRGLALSLGLVVALLAMEGAVRLRHRFKYGSTSATVHAFVIDTASGLRIPTPGMKRGGISINALGFRGPELTVPKPPGTVRIAFLGGSTTYCAEVSSNELTWPHLVTQGLRSRYPQLAFDYVNGGAPGYSTIQSTRNLKSRISSLEPDVIVIYHGTNDLSADTRQLARKQGVWKGPSEATSRLGKLSTLWFLLEKNWTVFQRQREAQQPNDRLEFEPYDLSREFEKRLTKLVELAQDIAPVVAVATFSHRIRHEQTNEEKLRASNTSLYYMPYMTVDGLLAGFDEYNRVIRHVSRTQNVTLIQGELEIPGDGEHFVDSVHFSDEGSRLMAGRVVPALAASLDAAQFP